MTEDGAKARAIIAIIAVSSLVLLSAALMVFEPPKGARDVLFIVVGALVAFCADVKQFYFGSSSGNKVLMQNQQRITEQAVDAAAKSVPANAVAALGGAGPAPTGAADDPVSVVVAPEDPGLVELRELVKRLNPGATEESIIAAYAAMQAGQAQPRGPGVDFDPSRR